MLIFLEIYLKSNIPAFRPVRRHRERKPFLWRVSEPLVPLASLSTVASPPEQMLYLVIYLYIRENIFFVCDKISDTFESIYLKLVSYLLLLLFVAVIVICLSPTSDMPRHAEELARLEDER